MIFCASSSVSAGAASAAGASGVGSAVGVGAATGADGDSGAGGEIRSVTVGATRTGAGGGGSTGFGAGTGGGLATIREIGGRKERAVRFSPSECFARGFFSSISDTVSARTRFSGSGAGTAAAAAASAAARDLAAGVAATAELRGALTGESNFAALAAADFGECDEVAAGLTVLRAAVADLRAVVLLVVRVGISVLKFLHGPGEATLLCNCFSRHGGVDLLRLRFIHTQDVDEI